MESELSQKLLCSFSLKHAFLCCSRFVRYNFPFDLSTSSGWYSKHMILSCQFVIVIGANPCFAYKSPRLQNLIVFNAERYTVA